MATQVMTRPASLLRNTLRVDAVGAMASGTLMVLAGMPLSGMLGIPAAALTVVGLMFLPYGYWLWRGAAQAEIPAAQARTWIIDFAWVLASAVLLLTSTALTPIGWWVVLLVAFAVADVGILKIIGRRG